jgi:plasmid stabilization system protein ParE
LKIKYSPDARDKLREIKQDLGEKITEIIVRGINGLSDNPRKCPTVENMLGVPNPYYFLHIQHNYVFYRIDGDIIYITDIYNEREDFMWQMFGIRMRTQESIDYWGE